MSLEETGLIKKDYFFLWLIHQNYALFDFDLEMF